MIVKRFKNGNYTAKTEPSDYDREDMLVHLLWELYDKDCTLHGDEYCLGNFEMACDVYDCYNDKLVMIPFRLLTDLSEGKRIRLYAREMSDDDREDCKRFAEGD